MRCGSQLRMICVVTRRCRGRQKPAPTSSSERRCCLASMLSGGRERGAASRASSWLAPFAAAAAADAAEVAVAAAWARSRDSPIQQGVGKQLIINVPVQIAFRPQRFSIFWYRGLLLQTRALHPCLLSCQALAPRVSAAQLQPPSLSRERLRASAVISVCRWQGVGISITWGTARCSGLWCS